MQNHLWNLWIYKCYCVVKKLVWNVRIKAFWYTKYIIHPFLHEEEGLKGLIGLNTMIFSAFSNSPFFQYCSPFSYRSTNFALNPFASFEWQQELSLFYVLKATAKSKSTNIAIASKSEEEQSFYLSSSLSPLSASKSDNYCSRNSWKSDNFIGSKRKVQYCYRNIG